MADIEAARHALVIRVLEGSGTAPASQRRAAFDNAGLVGPLRTLIDKLTTQAVRITDEDVAAARSSGLSEDQLFEIVVCGAIGQAARQYDLALAALAAATGKE